VQYRKDALITTKDNALIAKNANSRMDGPWEDPDTQKQNAWKVANRKMDVSSLQYHLLDIAI